MNASTGNSKGSWKFEAVGNQYKLPGTLVYIIASRQPFIHARNQAADHSGNRFNPLS
jgi:hypothetical protein